MSDGGKNTPTTEHDEEEKKRDASSRRGFAPDSNPNNKTNLSKVAPCVGKSNLWIPVVGEHKGKGHGCCYFERENDVGESCQKKRRRKKNDDDDEGKKYLCFPRERDREREFIKKLLSLFRCRSSILKKMKSSDRTSLSFCVCLFTRRANHAFVFYSRFVFARISFSLCVSLLPTSIIFFLLPLFLFLG